MPVAEGCDILARKSKRLYAQGPANDGDAMATRVRSPHTHGARRPRTTRDAATLGESAGELPHKLSDEMLRPADNRKRTLPSRLTAAAGAPPEFLYTMPAPSAQWTGKSSQPSRSADPA
eukprot:CAMPEP_0176303090 /NCGR_PEP_ID=MMETSP0121_2-20121125/61723_1 /TAXON_ID=160619 /ORGANISM="Kryptoperidinium foliaceum, Strain CCMP 1326" /LENGTH=118 /DNA_ID=CAMNT_0017644629 /DNA_START=103 /DNA_END=456 /DNA_ORIENTATION=+